MDNVRQMKFQFIGNLKFDPSEGAKIPFVNKIESPKGKGYKVKGVLAAKKNNTAIIEMFGWKPGDGVIKTFNTENEAIEIDWADREDKEVIESVNRSRKNTIAIEDERTEFVSSYDACRYIIENVDEFKNDRFYVTGDMSRSWNNGKEYTSFNINNIYVVGEDDKRHNQLCVTTTFFWTKDSIDYSDFKSDKKIYFDGYIPYYIREAKKKMYIPQRIVLDCTGIDSEDEQKQAIVEMNMEMMGIIIKDGKLKSILQSNKYYAHTIMLNYIHGAQDAKDVDEITMETLTPKQKRWIATGLYSLDDFKSENTAYGDFITEFQIYKFATKELDEKLEPIDIDYEDFEEDIYVPEQEFKAMNKPIDDDDDDEEEKPRKAEKKTSKKKSVEVDEDEDEDEEEDDEPPFGIDEDDEPKPKKKTKVKEEEPLLDTEEDEDDEPKPKSKPKKSEAKPKKKAEVDDESDEDLEKLFD